MFIPVIRETSLKKAEREDCVSNTMITTKKGIDKDNTVIGQKLTRLSSKTTAQRKQKEFKATDEQITEDIKEYKVQKGDNLSKIAQKYGTTVAKIKAANNLTSDTIKAGQILIIPIAPTPKVQTPQKSSSVKSSSQPQISITAEDKAKYLKALTHSDTAIRNNIDNTPKDLQTRLNLNSLIETTVIPIVQELEKNGIKIQITSGYRSPELNKKVGGAVDKNGNPKSQHCKGEAFDFQVIPNNKETIKRAFEIIKNSNIPIDQMLLERNKKGTQWIHVSHNPTGKNRRYLIANYKAQ